jgi:hypothetical protein
MAAITERWLPFLTAIPVLSARTFGKTGAVVVVPQRFGIEAQTVLRTTFM